MRIFFPAISWREHAKLWWDCDDDDDVRNVLEILVSWVGLL